MSVLSLLDALLTKSNTRASDKFGISAVNYFVNNIGQRTNATHSGAATNSTTWGYDALGQHARRLVGRAGLRSKAPRGVIFPCWGKNYQLTKADDSNNPADRAYQYDGIGNRLTSSAGVSPASSTTYIPNALNQYDAINTFDPSYDDDGNQEDA